MPKPKETITTTKSGLEVLIRQHWNFFAIHNNIAKGTPLATPDTKKQVVRWLELH